MNREKLLLKIRMLICLLDETSKEAQELLVELKAVAEAAEEKKLESDHG